MEILKKYENGIDKVLQTSKYNDIAPIAKALLAYILNYQGDG